jgi:NADPH:quinone reductase-like Zn-dependent oxidoreductase
MQAIVYTTYGSPDVLQLKEVEKPTPKDNEVQVRIHATTATAAHLLIRTGRPYIGRLFIGIRSPKNPNIGTEFAGEVEAVGKDVKLFKVGDQVFGATGINGGCYADYNYLPEDGVLTMKPTNMTYAQAAAVLDGASTALHFLRDKGSIRSGQKVLINGASGSVGTAAVQLAKYFGAEVSGVCSTANHDMVKSLGADTVIDYTTEDFTKSGQTYDIIFDAVAKSSFQQCKSSLKQNGIYLTTVAGLPQMVQSLWTSVVGSKKARFGAAGLRSTNAQKADLIFLKDLIEAGKIKAVIDRCYPLEQTAEAHRYIETGRKKGNVVITVAQNDND